MNDRYKPELRVRLRIQALARMAEDPSMADLLLEAEAQISWLMGDILAMKRAFAAKLEHKTHE